MRCNIKYPAFGSATVPALDAYIEQNKKRTASYVEKWLYEVYESLITGLNENGASSLDVHVECQHICRVPKYAGI